MYIFLMVVVCHSVQVFSIRNGDQYFATKSKVVKITTTPIRARDRCWLSVKEGQVMISTEKE